MLRIGVGAVDEKVTKKQCKCIEEMSQQSTISDIWGHKMIFCRKTQANNWDKKSDGYQKEQKVRTQGGAYKVATSNLACQDWACKLTAANWAYEAWNAKRLFDTQHQPQLAMLAILQGWQHQLQHQV
jgi:hypothetical protein